MTWDDALTRLEEAGLKPVEEIYMENYGKVLTAQRPEFRERVFRCTYGVVNCVGMDLELFMFPDQIQRDEFMDVVGGDPWWFARDNVVLHFPESDPAIVRMIIDAIS